MPTIADLSSPKYWENECKVLGVNVLAIGWLGKESIFEIGDTSDEFRRRLFEYCMDDNVVLLTFGINPCEFCDVDDEQWYREGIKRYGENTSLMGTGNGEIRVPGKNVVYAAPTLIYHYVIEHGYKPPLDFIASVLSSPEIGSVEYREFMRRVMIALG